MRSDKPQRLAALAMSAAVLVCSIHTGASAAVVRIDGEIDSAVWGDNGSPTDRVRSPPPANDIVTGEGAIAGDPHQLAGGWQSAGVPEIATSAMILLWGGGFILARVRRYRSAISIE